MSWVTYVFPAAALMLIGIFFLGCRGTLNTVLSAEDGQSFSRRELALLLIICLIYTAAAFYKLGDTDTPQSFAELKSGQMVSIDLGKETEIDGVMYYSWLRAGDFSLLASDDGKQWTELARVEQPGAAIFKWHTLEAQGTARYIMLSAVGDLSLGELVFMHDGRPAAADGFDCPERLMPLFDEQELVPERPDYMNSTYFDEIYHARTAYENTEDIYPYEVSHPPLGKLIISIGIGLFGMTPFGWRFMGTLFGVLMLIPLYFLIKRMFGGKVVPLCGTAIFAFDFMHLTQTRIATIDTYAVFFIILMYLFMYLWTSGGKARHLALSGLFFGLGAASKWTCIYAGGGLAVIWLLNWIRLLRSGKRFGELLKNSLFCVVFFVFIPAVIYYLSYIPYGRASGMGKNMLFTKEYARIVLDNQKFMLSYHRGVHSEHPYASRWYCWIFDIRPILYYLDYRENNMLSTFGAFLNPVLCWAGLGAMCLVGCRAVKKHDRLAWFILIGYLAQLLPWVFIGRVTFEYHYFPSAVFLTLALCYVFSLMEKTAVPGWKNGVLGITGISLLLFVLFYPVLTGREINRSVSDALLGWFPTWPF